MTKCLTNSPNYDFHAPKKVNFINSSRISTLDVVVVKKDLEGEKGKMGLTDDFGLEIINYHITLEHPEDPYISFRFNIHDAFLFFDSVYYKGVKRFATSLFAEDFVPNIGVTLQYIDKNTPHGEFYIINEIKKIEARLCLYNNNGVTYQQYQVKERSKAVGANLHKKLITLDGIEYDLNQLKMQPRAYIHPAFLADCLLSGVIVNIADQRVVEKICLRFEKLYGKPHPKISSIDQGIIVNAHDIGSIKKFPLQIENTLYSPTGNHGLCVSTSGYLTFGLMAGLNELAKPYNEELLHEKIIKGQTLSLTEGLNYHLSTCPKNMTVKEKLEFSGKVASVGTSKLRGMKHKCGVEIVTDMLNELTKIMPDIIRSPESIVDQYKVFDRKTAVTRDFAGSFRDNLEIIKNVLSFG